jgi:cell division protein FtsW (lipid II flippase)
MSRRVKCVLWYVLLAGIIAVLATIVWHYFGGLAAGIVVIVPLAMIANGWLATWEDERPGGFNNPRKSDSSASPDDVRKT